MNESKIHISSNAQNKNLCNELCKNLKDKNVTCSYNHEVGSHESLSRANLYIKIVDEESFINHDEVKEIETAYKNRANIVIVTQNNQYAIPKNVAMILIDRLIINYEHDMDNVSKNGQTIVSRLIEECIISEKLITGKCNKTLECHTSWVWCLVALSNGLLASGSGDNTIRIWE